MNTNVLKIVTIAGIFSVSGFSFAQNKLTRNQILNAVRTHQQNVDSVQVSVGDSVMCDSTTTKITLEVINDSVAKGNTYMLTFTKNEIEVNVYDANTTLYRSTFEYGSQSFGQVKDLINNQNLRKVDSYNDSAIAADSHILKLYRGTKSYMSVENYSGRTNVTHGFNELVIALKEMSPDIASVISFCGYSTETELSDTINSDTINVMLTVDENALVFKSKGGVFKKIKVTCSVDDWEILEYPEWIAVSRNNRNEIILESAKNESKSKRTGIIKVGCLGEMVEVSITQL